MSLNYVHLHLLLNHFPTVGFGVGLGLFISALVRKSDELTRASLVILFLSAAVTIATYVTGNDAQFALKDVGGALTPQIEEHETAALYGFVFMQIVGVMSWFGLWVWRRIGRAPMWNLVPILIFSVLTFATMARAANLGGQIRHDEIHAVQEGSPPAVQDTGASATLARAWGHYVENHNWVWPTAEILHYVGLCLLFVVVLVVDLRMLGLGKRLSFEGLYQLLPLGMLGFTLNLATGMMFFVATPKPYTGFVFFLKMMLVVLGAVNILYFMLFDEAWAVGEGQDAPATAKLAAVSAIVIWIAVLICGRLLPVLGNSF
jgi:uncharacterized membrane protein